MPISSTLLVLFKSLWHRESLSIVLKLAKRPSHSLRLWDLKKKGKLIPHEDNPIVFVFWTCLQLER